MCCIGIVGSIGDVGRSMDGRLSRSREVGSPVGNVAQHDVLSKPTEEQ